MIINFIKVKELYLLILYIILGLGLLFDSKINAIFQVYYLYIFHI
jgi:hypothetical protein